MHHKISDNLWNILACPHCGRALRGTNDDVTCSICNSRYNYTKSGSIDLRLQRPKAYQYDCELGTSLLQESGFDFDKSPKNSNPEVDFSNFVVPRHLSREIMSHFPRAKTDKSLMLDLGCGNMVHQGISEFAGFEHVGVDYDSSEAPILGDAHALPFKDDSFELILSIAVLEHIRFPFIMLKEVFRVLKPDGIFIGTVSFLEPFHWNSFYHHTHLGTYNSLKEGGFKIEHIFPNKKWLVLESQAVMGLFPLMPRLFSKLLVMPIQILHKIWWRFCNYILNNAIIIKILGKIGKTEGVRVNQKEFTEEKRVRNTAGSFAFIVRK